jgi:dTDP-4-amino-4,6-dideoxygalactose transaminase
MILMNDFKAEPAALKDAMLAAVSRVIDSGWYVLGAEVERFEQAWAEQCACSHGVGVGNGMDAIEVGLRALNIGEGDEVITTPMTAFATVLAILRAGATPVLADIDPDTAHLDMDSVARCLSSRTKAVVLVHLYGQVSDLDAWADFCRKQGIHLVEDCAQAHLASWKGQRAGSVGSFGAYSFYPTKNLGALGDGGMLVTSDAALATRAASLRNYGQSVRYHHPELGMNSRLDELHAAMLSERLKYLSGFTECRRVVARAYESGIDNPAVQALPLPADPLSHVHHLFVLRSERREALQQHLTAAGVQSHIHYPIPVHHQEPTRGLRTDPQGLRAAEAHAQTCLSLPCHPFLSAQEVQTVVDAVNSFR